MASFSSKSVFLYISRVLLYTQKCLLHTRPLLPIFNFNNLCSKIRFKDSKQDLPFLSHLFICRILFIEAYKPTINYHITDLPMHHSDDIYLLKSQSNQCMKTSRLKQRAKSHIWHFIQFSRKWTFPWLILVMRSVNYLRHMSFTRKTVLVSPCVIFQNMFCTERNTRRQEWNTQRIRNQNTPMIKSLLQPTCKKLSCFRKWNDSRKQYSRDDSQSSMKHLPNLDQENATLQICGMKA